MKEGEGKNRHCEANVSVWTRTWRPVAAGRALRSSVRRRLQSRRLRSPPHTSRPRLLLLLPSSSPPPLPVTLPQPLSSLSGAISSDGLLISPAEAPLWPPPALESLQMRPTPGYAARRSARQGRQGTTLVFQDSGTNKKTESEKPIRKFPV